jgi:hypothetical protein
METIYQAGNTVRLECIFYDFNNQLIDPNNIKLKIYNNKYELINEFNVNKKDLGKYYYDYTTLSEPDYFYYEWYGEIDSLPSIKRGSFKTIFA